MKYLSVARLKKIQYKYNSAIPVFDICTDMIVSESDPQQHVRLSHHSTRKHQHWRSTDALCHRGDELRSLYLSTHFWHSKTSFICKPHWLEQPAPFISESKTNTLLVEFQTHDLWNCCYEVSHYLFEREDWGDILLTGFCPTLMSPMMILMSLISTPVASNEKLVRALLPLTWQLIHTHHSWTGTL